MSGAEYAYIEDHCYYCGAKESAAVLVKFSRRRSDVWCCVACGRRLVRARRRARRESLRGESNRPMFFHAL